MKTTTMISKTLLAAEAGDVKYFHMPKSSRGIVHFNVSSGTGTGSRKAEVRLQGRLSEDQGWVDVELDDSSDFADLDNTIPSLTFQDVQIFPEMRANVSTLTYLSAAITL